MMYAPIIVFAYNRPNHLKRTLEALAKNEEAVSSELYIFIDGSKTLNDKKNNDEVYCVALKYCEGFFKNVVIRKSEVNRGLAKSIIAGVGEIINKYGRVIVTEDDSVCAPSYLSFMNEALDYYQDKSSIWSIGGYTVPIEIPEDYVHDVILTQRSSSYAWATWKDRWNKIDWEVKDYKTFQWDFHLRAEFNEWGNDRSSMMDDQMRGRVNSWAIRFDYAMFKNGMFNVFPKRSLIQNIGHDGSGTHSIIDMGESDPFAVNLSSKREVFEFDMPQINEKIKKEYTRYFQTSKRYLVKRFVSNLLYKNEDRK